MVKVVVIGSANMDTTHKLRGDFPDELTQESLNEIESTARVLGGKGFNQARAIKLQNPNAQVSFIGCIGKDEEGIKVLEEMQSVGIDYAGVNVLDGFRTDGRIITVNDKGENRMIGYGDCVKQLKPEMIDLSILDQADLVAIQMKMPEETVRFIIEYCEMHEKALVIDPTPQENSSLLVNGVEELINKVAYLTPNEEEAFALIGYIQGKTIKEIKEEFKNTDRKTRLEQIKQLVKRYPNIIATIGDEGVIYNNGRRVVRKETYPTECIDSTGAGDTFNGGFVGALARGEDLKSAIKFGLMASSMKVRYRGAQNGVPTYEEVKKAIKEYDEKNNEIDEE